MKIRLTIHLKQLLDLENPHNLKAFALALQGAALVAGVAGVSLSSRGAIVAVTGALLALVGAVVVIGLVALFLSHQAARGAVSFVAPSGRSTPAPDDYSYEKSLLVRGKVGEALTELEVRLANIRPTRGCTCSRRTCTRGRHRIPWRRSACTSVRGRSPAPRPSRTIAPPTA